MSLLALLFSQNTTRLLDARHWLERVLARSHKTKSDITELPSGLYARSGDPALHHIITADNKMMGRLGYSQTCPASDITFDKLLQQLPAMSAAWCWQAKNNSLSLALDPVGARPLYYAQTADCILVSSALWLIESCPWVNLSLDDEALHQRIALGYCLGGKTPYKNVNRVQGGAMVHLSLGDAGQVQTKQWHSWSHTATDRRPLHQQLDDIHDHFMHAVAAQDNKVDMPVAALSGGLDTRVVIAGLLAHGRTPHTLSFTWRNSLDGIIAEAFAKAAGLPQTLRDVPRPLNEPFLIKTARALRDIPVISPLRLWTGYGGSVGAGYVHSNPDLVAHARAGQHIELARGLLKIKGAAISPFLFGAARAAQLMQQLVQALAARLAAYETDDPGRIIQLYLLEHQEPEQLRPLTENADLLGFDVAAPFYDPALLKRWLAIPLDQAAGHHAYVQWMQRLPKVVMDVPWQAYPGHVQSPLPLPKQSDQWSDIDAHYVRQQSANDVAYYKKVGTDTVLVAHWRQWLARLAVQMGGDKQSYLLRTLAGYAAFEQGAGAKLSDGIAESF
jgi:asparagine synthase (glutamine-hydrolysing)